MDSTDSRTLDLADISVRLAQPGEAQSLSDALSGQLRQTRTAQRSGERMFSAFSEWIERDLCLVAETDAPTAAGRGHRVVGVLPEGLRLQVETSGLFAPDWSPVPPEPWLPALRRAIREGNAVRLWYRDAQGRASERLVWPFAMAFLADMRLLAAWCESRADFRHFRADRVLGLEDTGRRYPEQRQRLVRRWERQRLRGPGD